MTFTLTPWRLTLDSYRDEEAAAFRKEDEQINAERRYERRVA